MTEKLPTIKLKGKDYVQVKDRVLFFNEYFENGSIITEVKHKEDGSYAWFKAIITPDTKNLSRTFTAHSAGPVDEEKSYEKLETVAVGRALALMGIGVLEGIASADEMQKFENKKTVKPNYIGTQYENRKQTASREKVEFLPGDELRTGNKNGKQWYGIKRGKDMIWLNKEQYEYLSNVSQGENYEPLTETFSDSAPLPSEF